MSNLSDDVIKRVRSQALNYARYYVDDEVQEIPSYFENHKNMSAIECLGESIKLMTTADLVIFTPGWQENRGCRVEHHIATEYDLCFIEL